jgi:excisionase family DNA binding protein
MTNTYLSTKEAARALKVSERTLRNMILRGSIKAEKLDPNCKSVYTIAKEEIKKILTQRTRIK